VKYSLKSSLIMLLTCTAFVLSTFANAADSLKIGVIDIQAAIDASHHVKKINEKLEKEFGPIQSDLKALSDEIISLEERFVKDSAVMGETELRRLQQEIAEKKSRLKFEGVEMQRKLQTRQQELSAPLMKLVDQVVKEFNAEGKYDLILHKQTALFVKDEHDLTQQLTQRLNKK
jgi:outer membrane protein